jgi:hypothetical protein
MCLINYLILISFIVFVIAQDYILNLCFFPIYFIVFVSLRKETNLKFILFVATAISVKSKWNSVIYQLWISAFITSRVQHVCVYRNLFAR